MTLRADIDGQSIIFTDLQVDVEDHNLGNVNEGEEVDAVKVEHVEALVEGGGGGGGVGV